MSQATFKSSQLTLRAIRGDKVRWSLRQRLRKQLQQLLLDFFDEVDDYFFSSARGQADSDSVFFKSMRELRTKQSLFEEHFLAEVLALIKNSQAPENQNVAGLEVSKSTLTTAAERIEIDLAVRAMQRKAEKSYGHFYLQLDGLNNKQKEKGRLPIIKSRILVQSVLCGFQKAQHCLTLPLEARLVFAKLFEKSFLLAMAKIFTDILSIATHEDNPEFVNRLYSSSSVFNAQNKQKTENSAVLESHRSELAARGAASASAVEKAVTSFVSELCDSHKMPLFVEKMIRTQWRSVMFLIGLNGGCDSVEWSESKYSVLMLAAASADGSKIGITEKSLIIDQIVAGFKLMQIDIAEQETFLQELKQLFGFSLVETGSAKTELVSRAGAASQADMKTNSRVQEASISPAGKHMLDKEDLDELADLLGGSQKPQQEVNSESDLQEYLLEVDQLVGDQHAQYKAGNIFKDCVITRNASDFFEIHLDDELTGIKRSRLGLAMAIKQGDVRLNQLRITRSISSVTVLDRHIH